MELKCMTFNVQHCMNYVTRDIDYCLFARVILQSGADIIGVNEIYEPQAEILAEKLGYGFHFAPAIHVNGAYYGNALFTRRPLLAAETVMIPDPPVRDGAGYETRAAAVCRVAAGETELTVIVTHFGLNPDEQQNAASTAAGLLRPQNCILMGDFNVTPENEVLAPIRAQMTDAADLFPAPLKSFPSDAPDRKIDYIFVSPDLKITAADIPAVVASDHRPHTAVIRIETKNERTDTI